MMIQLINLTVPVKYFVGSVKSNKVGYMVVLGLHVMALSDSISVYIGPSPREREREKRNDRREKKKSKPPPAPTASAIGPCPSVIQVSRTSR